VRENRATLLFIPRTVTAPVEQGALVGAVTA
jgi:hypothetical protein